MVSMPPWAQALVAPASSSGEPSSVYLDALQRLRTLMAGHTAAHGGPVPWAEVSAQAQALLAQHKDLKVAAYLIAAETRVGGAPACACGLEALARLCGGQWATLTPPVARLRGRIAALSWLHEELAAILPSGGAVGQDVAQCMTDAGETLDDTLGQLAAESVPAFARLAGRLRVATPQAPPTASALPPKSAVQPAHRTSQGGAAPAVSLAQDMAALGAQLVAEADRQLALEPTQPAALRLRRQGLFLHIDEAPPLWNEVTRVLPLPEAQKARLKALYEQQAWGQLLEASEQTMLRHRLHLVLQRYSAAAVAHLGPHGPNAARAIAAETWSLILRLPELASRKAVDGSALIDDDTRHWLQGFAPEGRAAAAPAKMVPNSPYATAAQSPSAPSEPRALFLHRLHEARAVALARAPAVAHSALRALTRQTVALRLWQWEPTLAASTWEAEAHALRALPAHPRKAARMAHLVRLMATVDVSRAQQLTQTLDQQGAQS